MLGCISHLCLCYNHKAPSQINWTLRICPHFLDGGSLWICFLVVWFSMYLFLIHPVLWQNWKESQFGQTPPGRHSLSLFPLEMSALGPFRLLLLMHYFLRSATQCHLGSFFCLPLTSESLIPRSYAFISLYIPSFYWGTFSRMFLRKGAEKVTFLWPFCLKKI